MGRGKEAGSVTVCDFLVKVDESNIKLTVLIDLCSCDRILDHSIDNDDVSLSMGIGPKLHVHSG